MNRAYLLDHRLYSITVAALAAVAADRRSVR
jgi:hypothetical protein